MAERDFTTGLGDIGGAVSDLFAAKGSSASAGSFDQASAIANRNATIAREATAIQEMQESRQIYKVLGTQKAQIGGAGFAASGTALDLLRSSASQGALMKALTAEQGAISENSYLEQAGLYGGMAASARATGTAQTIGGVLNLASGALNIGKSLFSGSSVGADATAAGASADAAAVASGDTAAGAAAGTGTFGAAGTVDAGGGAVAAGAGEAGGAAAAGEGAAVVGEGAAAAEEGEGLAVIAEAAVAAWIICTELHRQGRMPSRRYHGAASAFLAYPERGKRGYYVWAIPSVRHLRAHPQSAYSRLMETVFNCRSQYIFDRRRGKRGSIAGAIATHGLYAFCWALSWFVPKRLAQWTEVYAKHR